MQDVKLYLVGIAGIVRNDNTGVLSGGHSIDIASDTNLQATGPVNLIGNTLNLNYDNNDLQLAGGALQIKDSGVDHGSLSGLPDNDHPQYPLALIFAGLYNRNRIDKWQQKGKVNAVDRYTLQTPTALAVYLHNKLFYINAIIDYDLSAAASWDTLIPNDYTVAANRAGKDFYIYACESSGPIPRILLSDNTTSPVGYTTITSRLIGGFHCLCVSVGAIGGHPLTNFLAGDLLPDSIWDYNHRPVCSPAGMVYSETTGIWVDIYLASGIDINTKSVNGGVISDIRNWMDFVDDGGAVKKRLLNDFEFQLIAEGSNQTTNIAGGADPVTTSGHTDTAGRRMISNIGCEDCCGVMQQWLLDQMYRNGASGSHSHNQTIKYKAIATGSPVFKDQAEILFNAVNGSVADEIVTSSNTDPVPPYIMVAMPGGKGSIYRQLEGDTKLCAGGNWGSGVDAGSRSHLCFLTRETGGGYLGARFASESI